MKQYFSYKQQLELLKNRGLIIDDEVKVLFYLKYIGYYRLSGYFKNFQNKEDNMFFEGASFEKVLRLYIFDRKLRLLFLDAIERIEVSFRTLISDTMCFKTNEENWFSDKQNYFFHEKENWTEVAQFKKINNIFETAITKSKENFIKEYKNQKGKKSFESWKLFSILSFGEVSFLFTHLNRDLKKAISKEYNINFQILQSWMISLSYIRNICAHHSRLWNRNFDKQFNIPKFLKVDNLQNNKLFFALLCILQLFKIITPNSTWKIEIEKLLIEYSDISKEDMGFPKNWKKILSNF